MQASKVISVFLMLPCFFFCVTALGLNITEDQYAAFKGIDPLSNCNNPEAMKTMCTNLGKPVDASGFTRGYPACEDGNMLLIKRGGGTFVIRVQFLICKWDVGYGANVYYVCGKGQSPNHVMFYVSDRNGDYYAQFDATYP